MATETVLNKKLLTVPLSGILGGLGVVLRGPDILPNNPEKWAETVLSSTFVIYSMIILVAYILPLSGFWEMYLLRKNKRTTYAFILSVLGTILALPTFGVVMFAGPYFAKLYLAGDTSGVDFMIGAINDGMILGIISAICYSIRPILYTLEFRNQNRVIWLFGLHGILLAFGFRFFPLLVLGWILLTMGSIKLINLE